MTLVEFMSIHPRQWQYFRMMNRYPMWKSDGRVLEVSHLHAELLDQLHTYRREGEGDGTIETDFTNAVWRPGPWAATPPRQPDE